MDQALPTTIIFASPGLKPDLRLRLFEKVELHVHSIILKLYSNYFRRFLDSPEKKLAPESALFKYEYSTVIDEDGTWALEPDSKAAELTTDMLSRMDVVERERQSDTFQKLLCAMYNRPYTLNDTAEIERITKIADFFCALPILSLSVTNALHASDMFNADKASQDDDHDQLDEKYANLTAFAKAAPTLIFTAMKLRNPILFRECFTHVVGLWRGIKEKGDEPRFKESPALWHLIIREYTDSCKFIMDVNQQLMYTFLDNSFPNIERVNKESLLSKKYGTENPQFYRKIYPIIDSDYNSQSGEWSSDHMKELERTLRPLLSSSLRLDKSMFSAGDSAGPFRDYFLCAFIEDKDMPWDSDQIDW